LNADETDELKKEPQATDDSIVTSADRPIISIPWLDMYHLEQHSETDKFMRFISDVQARDVLSRKHDVIGYSSNVDNDNNLGPFGYIFGQYILFREQPSPGRERLDRLGVHERVTGG
jgi:hypothetical protein